MIALMFVKVFAVALAALLLACSRAEPETEIIRIPVEVEVPVVTEVAKEVPVITEVPVEVPVVTEVIVEAPVALPNCPPASEVDWLIWSMEDARAMHQAWANYLRDNPLVEGAGLIENAMGSQSEQLSKVAAYDRRLSIVRQLQQACAY